MRNFKHLEQLSDDELLLCMQYVAALLAKIQEALQEQPDPGNSDKALHLELRHQQRVYDQLRRQAAMRRFS
jgi:hypothetical protein